MDTPFFTPRSGTFDTSSIPFVFKDGVLSLYSPRTDYNTFNDSEPGASPPFSSFSNASFLDVLPNRPRSGKSFAHPILQRFAIWQHNEKEDDHVYAEASCSTGAGIREAISLEDLDPSLLRYGAVRAQLAQISRTSCPCMHLSLPLTPFAPNIAGEPHPIESVITISTPSRSPIRLGCSIYHRGTMVYTNQTLMRQEGPLHFDDVQHSAGLPHQFVDELCRDLDGRYSNEDGMLHSTAVLLFMQHTDSAESSEEKVILVLVCNFEVGQGPEPNQARFSYLSPGTFLSQDMSTSTCIEFPPSPPLSVEELPNVEDFAFESVQSTKRRIARVSPKLSVAIPPPCHDKGRIQLYTDSPAPATHTPDDHFPLTPQSGVPENVCPVTQFPTPLHPPEVRSSSKVCSHAGDASILAESAYPFIMTTASPTSFYSPAFSLLDSSRRGDSDAAWPPRSQTCTPATLVSVLMQ